ncbi:MAG: hypothetical protein WA874_15270 [Chryseosolibacter sp.]
MGKEREGRFNPRKGKPSGSLREGVGLVKPINTSSLKEQLEIADKYTDGEEMPASNVHVRHHNRNVDKREERQRNKDKQRSNNGSDTSSNETLAVERADTVAEELPAMLRKEQFSELAKFQSERCVTIYMPTNSSTNVEANKQKDLIAFKNKLQQVTAALKDKNVYQAQIEHMLKPGYDLLRNDDFWSHLSNGLAVFISDGAFKYIKLPTAPKEEVLINSTFYLTPLIPVMTGRDYFYVLVLSKKHAKLFRADAFGMQYIAVPEMPNGVDDVVHFEEKDDQDLYRTDTAGAGAGASYHGTGTTGRPDDKTNIAMYFDEVDETIWKAVLHNENVPLLLAGVEYLIPIYKQVAQYKPIWDDAITGSHDHEDTQALYQQARAKMEPYFNERVAKALNTYGNQSATELTSAIPEDVIPAAHYGRIAQLFALEGQHIWGRFDEMNNELSVHASQEDGDECLVDKSVIRTLMNGGEVFLLPKEKMPGGSKLAALMRY